MSIADPNRNMLRAIARNLDNVDGALLSHEDGAMLEEASATLRKMAGGGECHTVLDVLVDPRWRSGLRRARYVNTVGVTVDIRCERVNDQHDQVWRSAPFEPATSPPGKWWEGPCDVELMDLTAPCELLPYEAER